jgi:hypothetical protein
MTREPGPVLTGFTDAKVVVGVPNGSPEPNMDDPPTATQVEVDGHETAVRLLTTFGTPCIVQVAPPFVVPMTMPSPEKLS